MRVCLFLLLFFEISCRTTTTVKSNFPTKAFEDPHLRDVPAYFRSPGQRKVSAIHNFLVGEYSFLRGDISAAHDAFARSYDLDPNSYSGGKSIHMLAEMGHLDKALVESKKLVLLYPKDSYLQYLHGQMLLRSGYLQKAQEHLETSLQLNDSFIAAHHALISLHIMQKNLYYALDVAKDMVDKIPSAIFGWSKLSMIYVMLGEKQQALAAARTAFEMKNTDHKLTLLYAYTLELNGHSQEAIAMYERLYRSNSTNKNFIFHLASLYKHIGGLENALALLDELANKLDEANVGVDMQRVIILWELRDYQRANAILAAILAKNPDSKRLMYYKALTEEKLDNQDQAIALYKRLLDDDELEVSARYRLALIFNKQERYQKAERELNILVNHKQSNWQFYALLASIYSQQKIYTSALKTVQAGFKKHSQELELLFLQGVYQEKLNNISGCLATMKQVIKRNPMHSRAFNYLGYLMIENNIDLTQALIYVQQALKIEPNNAHYLDSLAWGYYKLGNYDAAQQNILKALQQLPDEPIILEHYADILIKLNKPIEALEIYRRALFHFTEDSDVRRVQSKAKSIESNSS